MDWVSGAINLAFFLAGAGIVAWASSIRAAWDAETIDELRGTISVLRADAKRSAEANDAMVSLERDLGDARSLGPADELRVLLDAGDDQPAAADGQTGGRHKRPV